jgi:hypothetical protein
MVINYKRLNDNTVDDAYNIPNKQEWIYRIQGSKYFSKYDLKAGFWQVKIEEESITLTAFTCPQGHFEWLVMSFGQKNAPTLFQRKMLNIFNENQEFVLVYIDDLLIFSKSYKEHIAHLDVFFRKVEENGLILSKKQNGNMQRENQLPRSWNWRRQDILAKSYSEKDFTIFWCHEWQGGLTTILRNSKLCKKLYRQLG